MHVMQWGICEVLVRLLILTLLKFYKEYFPAIIMIVTPSLLSQGWKALSFWSHARFSWRLIASLQTSNGRLASMIQYLFNVFFSRLFYGGIVLIFSMICIMLGDPSTDNRQERTYSTVPCRPRHRRFLFYPPHSDCTCITWYVWLYHVINLFLHHVSWFTWYKAFVSLLRNVITCNDSMTSIWKLIN